MEKVLHETLDIHKIVGSNKQSYELPLIQKHLKGGWKIKAIFHQPYFINSIGPSSIIITVHLIKD